MNEGTLPTATADPPAARGPVRSPILNEARLNPFRVLRLPVTAGVDEAIWKSEELLTLLRAGVADPEPDPLPWLPPPGEPEIRQAVQAAEEPLRRLIARLSWFDFDADPAGDLLRKALATLDPADAAAYFATSPDAAVACELNRANLQLLLAARAFDAARPADDAPPVWKWEERGGLPVVVNPHAAEAAHGDADAAELWKRAVARWGALLDWMNAGSKFQPFLRTCLSELGDDLVGPDDADSVVNTLWTRLTDLLAGEIKAHLQEGRTARAAALLKVAADSPVEARRWVMALRSLRPKFKAEVGELDVLVAAPAPRFADIELYLQRVRALAAAWAALDPGNLMTLGELTDEAVTKAIGLLMACQDYATLPAVRALLDLAGWAAVADSVKAKAESAAARLDGLKDYACHFCQQRDMEISCSAVISGKKETGRTSNGNTTTIYYSMKRGFVPRCERCADLHEYLRWVGIWTWVAAFPLALLLCVWRIDLQMNTPERDRSAVPILLVLAFIAGVYALSGFVMRRLVSAVVTRNGERQYSDVSEARHYKEIVREGYAVTLDYSKGAYKNATGS